MLHILFESNARRVWFGEGAFVSVATHAALIALAVLATTDNSVETREQKDEQVFFLIPQNRAPTPPLQEELVSWKIPGIGGGNEGFLDAVIDKKAPTEAAVTGKGPDEGRSEKVEIQQQEIAFADTVITEIEADTAVMRHPDSAGPLYPSSLLEKKIEGSTYVQFIVDTTGFADVSSFKVLTATHPEFTAAVRDALPFMRFQPAVLRGHKVRQLVEQPFTFKIVPPAPPAKGESTPSS